MEGKTGFGLKNVGRMMRMKRISAGFLCFLLVLLLSTPALAEGNDVTLGAAGDCDIPVTLTVDTRGMVDVSIQWDSMNFSYDGKKVTPSGVNAPSITVTNNNQYANVTVTPEFVLADDMQDSGFELKFFDSRDTGKRGYVTAATEVGDTPLVFYASPEDDCQPNLTENKEYNIGKIRLTIDLLKP